MPPATQHEPTNHSTPSTTISSRKPSQHDIAVSRDPNRIRIFDTTLRDGEQSPGVWLSADDKLLIAKQLHKLGVDFLEAGFPIVSDGEFEAVKKIAQVVGNQPCPPIIAGFARAVEKDIIRCYDAIKHAAFPCIHISIATSDIHMKHKLRKSRTEVLEITSKMVRLAKTLCEEVEFGAEDAARSDPLFLSQVLSRAIEEGATVINVPDTVGYCTPAEIGSLFRYLNDNVQGISDVILSTHNHNDLGLAVANSLSAIEAGARQIEATVNGIGERAGNASLEEIVVALHVRRKYFNALLGTGADCDRPLTSIQCHKIYEISQLVSRLTGMSIQPNKAIVGENAFKHSSGIHQDGVLKHRQTYEIIDARFIGHSQNGIVLGKHSGRHAFRSRLRDMGYSLSDIELEGTFSRFKELADKQRELSDEHIKRLLKEAW